MKKIFFIALVLAGALFLAPQAHAQFTTVRATVVDPNGIPYANGVMSALLVPSTPGNWRLGGFPYNGRIGPVALDSTGSFSTNFGSNAIILPAGTQWQITVQSNPGGIPLPLGTGSQLFVVTVTISGATQNISATLNAAAPRLANLTIGSGSVTSVAATAPIVATPGPITTTGTISCPTCATTGGTLGEGQYAYGNSLNQIIGTVNVLDCAAYFTTDVGAAINSCVTAAANGDVLSIADIPATSTITTAVNVNKSVLIYQGNIQLTQNAAITLSATGASWCGAPGSGSTLTKAANMDQITVSGTNNTVCNLHLIGGNGGGFTGNGINLSSSSVNSTVDSVQIDTEASADIVATSIGFGNNLTWKIQNSVFHDDGVNALLQTNGVLNFSGNEVLDSGMATGSALSIQVSSGQSIINITGTTINVFSNAPAISLGSNQDFVAVSNSVVRSGGGYPAIDDPNGASLTLIGNPQILGGGVHGAAINHAAGRPLIVSGNFITGLAGGEAIDFAANVADQVSNNPLIQMFVTGVSGNCAVNMKSGLGGIISGNGIFLSDGAHASGINYGICLTAVAMHELLGNHVTDNSIQGTSSADDYGIYFNDTAAISTSEGNNLIKSNTCVDDNTCILRTDPSNEVNFYQNNVNAGTTTLFAAGGGTADVIVQDLQTFTFATLPTAGSGSRIANCSDCKMTVPTAASGPGGPVTNLAGAWNGVQLPYPFTCQAGLGDGLNAIPAGTYLQFSCVNRSGITWTITSIKCWTDNAGTSTLNAANNAATGLLTGAVTCNNTKSGGGNAGSQSATVTLANNDAVSFTFVADGTSTQTNWTVVFTQ